MYNRKISIRNAKFAKIGLQDFCDHVKKQLGSDITIIEIGSFAGDSAEIFAKNFKKVICIDPWLPGYDENDLASNPDYYDMKEVEAEFDVMASQFDNITKMKMGSLEASNVFKNGTIDIVYIDGLHTEEGVRNDIKIWLSKIKKSGIIAFHDYGSKHFPHVKEVINEKFGNPNEIFKDSSAIVLLGYDK